MKQIELTKGKAAFVDDEDYERLSQYKWHFLNAGNGYARTWNGGKNTYMHKMLLQTSNYVDHINGNGLDNRKENLRECTNSQNQGNVKKNKGTSKYKGVHKTKDGYFEAGLFISNKGRQYLGRFKSEDEAGHIYNKAAVQHFGEFAVLNPIGV